MKLSTPFHLSSGALVALVAAVIVNPTIARDAPRPPPSQCDWRQNGPLAFFAHCNGETCPCDGATVQTPPLLMRRHASHHGLLERAGFAGDAAATAKPPNSGVKSVPGGAGEEDGTPVRPDTSALLGALGSRFSRFKNEISASTEVIVREGRELVREGGALAIVLVLDAVETRRNQIDRIVHKEATRARRLSKSTWELAPRREEIRLQLEKTGHEVGSQVLKGTSFIMQASRKTSHEAKRSLEVYRIVLDRWLVALGKDVMHCGGRGIESGHRVAMTVRQVFKQQWKEGVRYAGDTIALAGEEWRDNLLPKVICASNDARRLGEGVLATIREVVVVQIAPACVKGARASLLVGRRVALDSLQFTREQVIPSVIFAARHVGPGVRYVAELGSQYAISGHHAMDVFALNALTAWENATYFLRQGFSWVRFGLRAYVAVVFLYCAIKTWALMGQLSTILPATRTFVDYFGRPLSSIFARKKPFMRGSATLHSQPIPSPIYQEARPVAVPTGNSEGREACSPANADVCPKAGKPQEIADDRRFSVPSPHAAPPVRRRLDDIRFRYISEPLVAGDEVDERRQSSLQGASVPTATASVRRATKDAQAAGWSEDRTQVRVSVSPESVTPPTAPVRCAANTVPASGRSENHNQVRVSVSPESNTPQEPVRKSRLRVPRKPSAIPRPTRRSVRPFRPRENLFEDDSVIDLISE